MQKFSNQKKAMLCVLSDHQVSKIHETALSILEETGVRFDSDRALAFLEAQGCQVDYGSKIVKFPGNLVNKAIEQAPEQFDMYNCVGEKTLALGQGNSYFAPGPGNPSIFTGEGEKRIGNAKDLDVAIQLAQKSPYLSMVSGSVVPDGTEGPADLYILYQAMMHSDKTILAEAWEEDSAEKVCRMIEEVKGSKEACIEKPFIMVAACPAPPMKWEERVINTAYQCMDYGIPVFICSSPIMGVSAPVTIAGGVLQHTVENLSFLTFMQLAHPGTPVFYGGICGTMDMRTTYSSLSSVEACLCTAGYACMARYYGIPSLAFLAQTDAKEPDYQAGFETCMGAFASMLSGIDIIYGAGVLDSYNCTSNEKLAMDARLLGLLDMFGKGIQTDEEMLGKEEIMEVNCADEESHMQREFTVDWYRDSQFMSDQVIDRSSFTQWQTAGTAILDRAAQAARKDMEKPYCVSKELEGKIEKAFRSVVRK